MKFMKKDSEIDQKHHQNCKWAKWRDGVIYKQRIHRVSQGMILLSRGLEPGSCCLTLTEADKSCRPTCDSTLWQVYGEVSFI